jgi:hypothetical protein
MAVTEMTGIHVLGFQTNLGDTVRARLVAGSALQTLVVRGRTTNRQPMSAKLILITKDAIPFSATITLPASLQDVEIPISRLQQDSMLLLPRPYPGFMPVWFSPSGRHSFSVADVEQLQIVVGTDLLPADFSKSYSMEIESVWIKK